MAPNCSTGPRKFLGGFLGVLERNCSTAIFIGSLTWLVFIAGAAAGFWKREAITSYLDMLPAVYEDLLGNPLRLPAQHSLRPGFTRYSDHKFSGYLLLAAYFLEEQRPGFKLLNLSNGQVTKTWYPDYQNLTDEYGQELKGSIEAINRFQPRHPLLMPDGGIVFIHDNHGPLVKIDSCSQIEWWVNDEFHHSLESDLEGNLIVAGVPDQPSPLPGLEHDHAVVVVDSHGVIKEKTAISEILVNNGLVGLLYTIIKFETKDVIHLNDVTVAKESIGIWETGDWLLSLRNLNLILIYRPANKKVTFFKVGPWINQHDVNFLRSGDVSVFGNDIILGPRQKGSAFDSDTFFRRSAGAVNEPLLPKDHNSIYIIDPRTMRVQTAFENLMQEVNMRTETQGRATITEGGQIVVEETNFGRIFGFGERGIVWSYYNSDGRYIGNLNWSRYISETEIAKIDLSGPCP